VAWAIDDTGFVKDGHYSGTLGKVGNCRIRVSVHAVTDTSSCPLNWRLFLPPAWDHTEDDEQTARQTALKRRRCGIPSSERYRPKVADGRRDARRAHRLGTATSGGQRGLDYAVQVKGQVTAHPADTHPQLIVHERSGPGQRSLPRYRTKSVSLREHVLAAGRATARTLA